MTEETRICSFRFHDVLARMKCSGHVSAVKPSGLAQLMILQLYRNTDIRLDFQKEKSVEPVDYTPVKALQKYDVPAEFRQRCQLTL